MFYESAHYILYTSTYYTYQHRLLGGYYIHHLRDAFKMTSSLLSFTPARPNLIVTSLKSDHLVFPGPPSAHQKE